MVTICSANILMNGQHLPYLRDKVIECDNGTCNVQWRIKSVGQVVRKAVVSRESRLFHPILVSLRRLVVVILFQRDAMSRAKVLFQSRSPLRQLVNPLP